MIVNRRICTDGKYRLALKLRSNTLIGEVAKRFVRDFVTHESKIWKNVSRPVCYRKQNV